MFDNRYFLPRVVSQDARRLVQRDPARTTRRPFASRQMPANVPQAEAR